MTDKLELRILPEGTAYVRRRLSSGLALSRKIIERLNLDRGTTISLLPPTTSREEALKFNTGGIIHKFQRLASPVVPINHIDESVARIIAQLISPRGKVQCFFEEADARLGDPAIERSSFPVVTYGREVYYTSSVEADTGMQALQNLLAISRHPRSSGCVSEAPSPMTVALSEVDLDVIASGVFVIVVPAYDLEGHLIWTSEPIVPDRMHM